jgi:hypothetical protein
MKTSQYSSIKLNLCFQSNLSYFWCKTGGLRKFFVLNNDHFLCLKLLKQNGKSNITTLSIIHEQHFDRETEKFD